MACQSESPRRTCANEGGEWGHLVGARDGGCYAVNRIVGANCGWMAAVNVGGMVAAVPIGGSSGGVGGVNARVLA